MTQVVEIRPADSCRFDVVTLGEVMLRLDPGEGRVRNARTFAVSEGGGEYNVGRALRRVFGHRVASVTAVGDSEIGRLLEDLLLQGGTTLDHVVWKPTDEVGRQHRTPLNFTERGYGVRAPLGVYDRAHSATATMQPDDVDWDQLFGDLGSRWFHTGGIFAGLSDSTFATAHTAIQAARRHGTVVSYDVNYRPSLWRAAGGEAAHRQLTDQLVRDVDVLFGVEVGTYRSLERSPPSGERSGPSLVATTRRVVHSASVHDWSGVAWTPADGVVEGAPYEQLAVLDRVGGGDAFASGIIHGLLVDLPLTEALQYGIAHGALVMTTPGDTSSANAAEVERVAKYGPSAIVR